MRFQIAVLPGDGIGPEVTTEAVRVLQAVGRKFNHTFDLTEDLVGGASIDKHGVALRTETAEACRRSHALIFGAVGGPNGTTLRPRYAQKTDCLPSARSWGSGRICVPSKSTPSWKTPVHSNRK